MAGFEVTTEASHAELLEAPQLGHLKVAVLDGAFVIQEDRDFAVALQPRDRIYHDFSHLRLRSKHSPVCDAASNSAG
jgi:hypothetical protein